MRKSKPKPPGPRSSNLPIYALLAACVLSVYAQAAHFDFVTYDDPDYVTANPHVQAGLTAAGAAWAFTTGFAGNWFPLTWLSHMLDSSLFGADAGWHHLTNVLIHLASTLICFAWLFGVTGARWRSAMVAFLFALHPLHVESVAWVAERKDVLSGLFFILTLRAYTDHAARPARWRYVLALLLFCCGLMAKQMLVTMPVLLLLIDWWPLNRAWMIAEKLPFCAASVAVSIVTFLVHRQAGAVAPIPIALRVENALVSYVVYILQMFRPVDLAVFYPYPLGSLLVPALLAGIAVAALSGVALRYRARVPYLVTGWFWYVVMLLPVIGIVQVGGQSHADRYTYLPMLGLSLAIVWGAADALARRPAIRPVLAATACAACLLLTYIQVGYWSDSVALYRHAIDATAGNYVAHYNLAAVYEGRGQLDDAAAQLRESIRFRPAYAPAYSALGQILARQGHPELALPELRTFFTLRAGGAEDRLRLANVLGALGRHAEATREFAESIHLDPNNADAHYDFGITLAQSGDFSGAAREFRATLALRPNDSEARHNLDAALNEFARH